MRAETVSGSGRTLTSVFLTLSAEVVHPGGDEGPESFPAMRVGLAIRVAMLTE